MSIQDDAYLSLLKDGLEEDASLVDDYQEERDNNTDTKNSTNLNEQYRTRKKKKS